MMASGAGDGGVGSTGDGEAGIKVRMVAAVGGVR